MSVADIRIRMSAFLTTTYSIALRKPPIKFLLFKIFIDKTATFQYTNVKYNKRWFDQ